MYDPPSAHIYIQRGEERERGVGRQGEGSRERKRKKETELYTGRKIQSASFVEDKLPSKTPPNEPTEKLIKLRGLRGRINIQNQ